MSTSSKGPNEKHRLHACVSTTVYDRCWKGTTEQFVQHFHEQLRQLDELTPLDKQLPHSVILTLLKTTVRSVHALRTVETMEEYMSLTNSYTSHYSITSDKYFTMLQNACIRYDKSLKQKPSTTARAIYQYGLDRDSGTDCEDGDYVGEGFAPDGKILHLMTSTISIPPISIGVLRLSPSYPGLPNVNKNLVKLLPANLDRMVQSIPKACL